MYTGGEGYNNPSGAGGVTYNCGGECLLFSSSASLDRVYARLVRAVSADAFAIRRQIADQRLFYVLEILSFVASVDIRSCTRNAPSKVRA